MHIDDTPHSPIKEKKTHYLTLKCNHDQPCKLVVPSSASPKDNQTQEKDLKSLQEPRSKPGPTLECQEKKAGNERKITILTFLIHSRYNHEP
jgi:hypothetical protein